MTEDNALVAESNELMQVAETSAHGSMYLFIGNALSTGILAIGSIITGRLLGPANYGLFSLSLVVPSILIGLSDLGIGSAITRFAARFKAEGRETDAKKVVQTGVFFELLIGIVAFLFCLIFSSWLSTVAIDRPQAVFYVRVASVMIVFQTIFNALTAAYVGLDEMKVDSIVMGIRSFFKCLLTPLLIFLGLGVFGALVGQVTSYVIGAAVGGVALSLILYELDRKDPTPTPNIDGKDPTPTPNIFKTMMKFGIPLYLSNMVGLIISQVQTIILAYFVSNAEIGNFQVAQLFQTAVGLVAYPFIALFPAFSKLNTEGNQINQFFRRSVKYFAMVIVPVVVAIALLSKDLTYAFYGSAYTLAPTYLAFCILLNLFILFGSSVYGYLFPGIGQTSILLKATLSSFVVFLPVAPVLTFLFGVNGLITSFYISTSFSMLYLLIMGRKKANVSPNLRASAMILVAALLSAAVLYIFLLISPFSSILNLILGVIIYLFAYLTLMPIINALTTTDLEIFKQMFYKIRVGRLLKIFIWYETKILEQKHRIKS